VVLFAGLLCDNHVDAHGTFEHAFSRRHRCICFNADCLQIIFYDSRIFIRSSTAGVQWSGYNAQTARTPSLGYLASDNDKPDGLLDDSLVVPAIDSPDLRRRAEVSKVHGDPLFAQLALYLKNPTFQVYLGTSTEANPVTVESYRKREVTNSRFVLNTRAQIASEQARLSLNRVSPHPVCVFVVQVKSGDKVFLRTKKHTYMDADPDGRVLARWPEMKNWQAFQM